MESARCLNSPNPSPTSSVSSRTRRTVPLTWKAFAGLTGSCARTAAGRASRTASRLAQAYSSAASVWSWLIARATTASVLEIPINIREGTDIRKLGLSPGQALLLKHWQRTNNVGDCWTISPWGNKPGQWTENTRARVAEELHAVKHWKVKLMGYYRPGTYFLDPPYIYNYRYRFPKDGFDYDELKRNIARIPKGSQIIVCEAACQKTRRVPRYLPFKPFASRITSRRKKTENHHSKEYLYCEHR